MPEPVRVLILEDSPEDAELLAAELRRADYAPAWRRVDTEADYLAHLRPDLDVILADYQLAGFDGFRALELLRERGLPLPFILVSGWLGEELAVDCVKQGAADVVLKHRLGRLGPAVRQALEQRRLREEKGRAEAALRDREARLRTILDTAADGIVTITAGGVIESFNAGAERLFGYPAAEAVGRDLSLLMPAPFRDEHPDYLGNYLRTGLRRIIGVGREVVGRRKDGSTFPADLMVSEMHVSGEARFTGIVRDLTERKKLEEQYRQAQKMEAVGRLACGLAHDFNNLLTVITGNGQLALDGVHEADPLRVCVEEILRAGERAAALTRQLLAFSRKQILELRVLDLNAVLRDLQRLLARLIGAHLELVLELAAEPCWVKADANQMEQVIVNLCVNARDAMPQGGTLTLRTAHVDRQARHEGTGAGRLVLLEVGDTGCGMGLDTQAHLFEPFFTTKAPGQGTGLGLATVFGIVRQSQGFIEVQTAPGQGSTFSVFLPAAEGAPAPAAARPGSRLGPSGTETVLLAESDEGVRQLTQRALSRQGYRVLEARHGAEALVLAEGHAGPIHLLLTDVVLPQLSGRQLAQRFQARHPSAKVLFMSGCHDDSLFEPGHQGGAVAILPKPFTPETLAKKVRELLDENG